MDKILDRLKGMISLESMLNSIINAIPNVIAALFILIVFIIMWKILQRFLNLLFSKLSFDKTVQSFIINITKNLVFILAVVTALSQVGINTGSILASLGVAGLTIGFAARDALSNIISGLFIFWDRPFVLGDLVEINGHYGKVEEITMRSTRLSTVDGKMLAIPNTQVLNSFIASYTNFPHLRIDIDFTVSGNENLSKIRGLILQLVENDEIFLTTPPPEIVLNSINDYNIELVFRVWIKNENDHIKIRFKLREAILEQLIRAKIEMPVETISVIMNNQHI